MKRSVHCPKCEETVWISKQINLEINVAKSIRCEDAITYIFHKKCWKEIIFRTLH